MKKYIILASILLPVLLLAQAAAASSLSSGEVKSIGEAYLSGVNELAALTEYTSTKPIDMDGNGYWVVYYFPSTAPADQYSTSFDKIVISDEPSGGPVRDQEVLENAFKLDYEYAWEKNYLKSQVQLSYTDIEAGVRAIIPAVETAKKNIETVRNNALARNYSTQLDEHFNLLQDKLSTLSTMLGDLDSQEISNGKEYQNSFFDTQDPAFFYDSIKGYNGTFSKLADFMDEAESFYDLLSTSEVYAQLNSDEGAVLKNIYAQGLGTDKFYSAKQLREGIQAQYNSFAREEGAVVNDSVKNSLFRIGKTNAQKAYRDAKGASTTIEYVLDRSKKEKQLFSDCSLGDAASQLNRSWANITRIMESKSSVSLAQYEEIPKMVSDAEGKKEAIISGLQNCLRGTPTPKPPENNKQVSDFLTIVAIVAIIGLGYVQFRKWQQKKEAEEEST